MRRVLVAAAMCNVLVGAWVVLWPGAVFVMAGMAPPNYPQLWQCIGVISAVFGLGYAIASGRPARHWPVVFLGLGCKVLAPVSIVRGLWTGALPATLGWLCVAHDVIWWLPFTMILQHAWDRYRHEGMEDAPCESAVLEQALTNHNTSLSLLSFEKPVLLVLLRHVGCTFCRNAMADISRLRPRIENAGAAIVLGHMSSAAEFAPFAERYGLGQVPAVSDPGRRLYLALGLKRGTVVQLMGPRVWARGARAFFAGHSAGKIQGDVTQMPGAFLIHQGSVVRRFVHQDASDKPDYVGLATLQG